jgi:protease IV
MQQVVDPMNEAQQPGLLRRILGSTWRLLDGTRRAVVNLIFLALLVALLFAIFGGGAPALKDKTVLVFDPAGPIVEQRSGSARDAALKQVRGEDSAQTRLRDVIAVLDAAAQDPKIHQVLLLLDELSGGGLATQREVAAAIERFKASGKTVVAWAASYDQRQYYIAAHANEVYLHPMGAIEMRGYGRLRNYWGDAFERLGVQANVVRAGKFKNAAETFVTNAPSAETLESEAYLFDAMWGLYTAGVEKARKRPAGSVMKAIDALPGSLTALGGDMAKLMLQEKWVDGLKTRDELRTLLIERGAEDSAAKTFRQVRFGDYLARLKPATGGEIGVVVAEGEISEGSAPPGRIGGLSTAELIRKARNDDKVKAIVLRVNSPGGSAVGSEFVRRELELARAAGKPVVVSMGDVAASGGYWISLAADEVIADAATITGSIGVIGLLPTGAGLMDKLSVRTGGHTTTWLGSAYDPRKALDPRYAELVQSAVGQIYADFTAKAAVARKTTPAKIDEVGQGRVWTGAQAKDRGLIDRTGGWADAVKAAATRAKLGDDAKLRWIERDPGRFERLLNMVGSAAVQSLGLPDLVAAIGGPLPGGAALELQQELSWLAEIADRRGPFAAVVHCFCEPGR